MDGPLIRKASLSDMPEIVRIYASARERMKKEGNPTQWGDSYPPTGLIEKDIEEGDLYLVTHDKRPCAVFAFVMGEDPTYLKIEGRGWLSPSPYGTIHRLASDGSSKGVFAHVLSYCIALCPHIRMDTHKNNKAMRHLALKHGFSECGIVYVRDGTPRIAFERL